MIERDAGRRALFFAGLAVLSAFAVTVAVSGTAAAATVDRGTGGDDWNTSTGAGTVGPGATLYQGETDVSYAGSSSFPEHFERAAGSNDGEVLSDPISQDQPTGSYQSTSSSETLTVQTPQITDEDVYLGSAGTTSVDGGTVSADTETVRVSATYNFRNAEDLEIGVYEGGSDGLEVTRAALASGESATKRGDATGDVTWELDLSNFDSGQYAVVVEGSDDLAWGDATQTMSFTVTSLPHLELALDQSDAVTGTNVRFQVRGGTEGAYHVVHIDSSDIDDSSGEHAFREVDDTQAVNHDAGSSDDHWALVEVSGGVGAGSIETAALEGTDVEITVSDAVTTDETPSDIDPADWNASLSGHTVPDDEDDATLSVTEGEISLANPTDFYVPGAQVTVNGTVSGAHDEVSLFAKDEGDYERVEINDQDTISITDGAFEAEDVDLADGGAGGGNDVLGLPGTYRLAAVAGTANGTNSLTAAAVKETVNDRVSLRVSEAELEAEATMIDGQVAAGDQIDVTGVAAAADEVRITLFGPHGAVGATSTPVESGGTFEAEDVDVQTPAFPGTVTLSQGTVIMTVGHDGRDGRPGDGQFPSRFGQRPTVDGATIDEPLQEMLLYVNGRHPTIDGNPSFTQQQAIDFVAAETRNDTSSDDQSQVFTFPLTSPRTTVDTVVGQSGTNGTVGVGSETTVEGTTNRLPDGNSITATVIDGPSADRIDPVSIEEWGADGRWTGTLDTRGLQPGTYTVEVDDGDSSDMMEFELAVSPAETPTDAENPASQMEAGEPANSTTADDAGGATAGEDGAGFGFVGALVALVAAALLAVRRHI